MAVIEEQEVRGNCGGIEASCIAEAKAGHALAPLLCYRAGKCHQKAGDTAHADDLYQQALDLDPRTVFGRATRAQNAVVRRLGAAYGIPVVDAVALLGRASPSGLLGNDLFGDGQHLNLAGMLLVARAYADAIASAFSTTVPRRSLTPREALAEFEVTPQVQARSHVLSGSWLIASAAHHPWPYDRLRLAETHLRSALAIVPDDFTAWFDLAVVQAAGRGLLRQADALEKLGKWSVFYRPVACVPDEEVEPMIDRFRSLGVEEDILTAIAKNRARACTGDNRANGMQ
jgi:tetratricopeptide (TPR) repeat protein